MACRWYHRARARRRVSERQAAVGAHVAERVQIGGSTAPEGGIVTAQRTPGDVDAASEVVVVVAARDLAAPHGRAVRAAQSRQPLQPALDPQSGQGLELGRVADQGEGHQRGQQRAVEGIVGVGGRPLDLRQRAGLGPPVEQVDQPAPRAGIASEPGRSFGHDRQGERLARRVRAVGPIAQHGHRLRRNRRSSTDQAPGVAQRRGQGGELAQPDRTVEQDLARPRHPGSGDRRRVAIGIAAAAARDKRREQRQHDDVCARPAPA